MANELPVVVAGGGIGGLCCALTLARAGHQVQVLERSAEFREVGAGIQLGPNVFRMFERLGLTQAMSDLAWFPGNLVMMDGVSAERVIAMPVGSDAFRARYGHPYAVIHRADIHRVLLDACRAESRVQLQVSTVVSGQHVHGDRVRVACEGAGGGGHRTLEAAALIGADGLWSTLRESIVGDGKPRVSGHVAYRAVLRRDQVPQGAWSDDVVLWAGPRTHLVHYPLRRGELFNLVAVFHSDRYEEGWNVFGDRAELQEKFAGALPQVRTLLERIDEWKMWVLCDREPVAHWSRGPVTLLGDAAHPMLQYLAQGACMAIEDAVVLAQCVQRSRGDFASAFLAYEKARYLRTARVQLTARFYGELYHAAGVAREVRNQLLGGGAKSNESPSFEGVAWLYDPLPGLD